MSLFQASEGRCQPTVCILAPQPEECVPGPDVSVHFEVRGITLSPCCNNLHFMLDDEPFEVQYDPAHPHIFHDVRPGTHTIRVFAANAQHEAIAGSMDLVTFSVAYPDEENRLEEGEPLLTYNLPQGEYIGLDAADVTLNYLVSGTSMGRRHYRVNYYVDGRRFVVYDCTTRHLKGLAPGLHTVRVELVDEHNNIAPGPFNAVERVILLSPHKSLRTLRKGEQPPAQPVIESIHGAMSNSMPFVPPRNEALLLRPEPTVRGVAPSISVRGARPRGELQHEFKVRDEEVPLEGEGLTELPAVAPGQAMEEQSKSPEAALNGEEEAADLDKAQTSEVTEAEEEKVQTKKTDKKNKAQTKEKDSKTTRSAIRPKASPQPEGTSMLRALDVYTTGTTLQRERQKTPSARRANSKETTGSGSVLTFQPFTGENATTVTK